MNGEVRAQEIQFALDDVEVVTATIDLEFAQSATSHRKGRKLFELPYIAASKLHPRRQ